MGTPEFMAPEQALGHALDGRADIYALGCVGYWLLTGAALFRKETAMQMLLAHISEPAPLPSASTPKPVPPALEAAIMACLEKSASMRPQTARELLQRLLDAERELASAEVWTDDVAHAWWQLHQPIAKPSQPSSFTPAVEPLRIADAVNHG